VGKFPPALGATGIRKMGNATSRLVSEGNKLSPVNLAGPKESRVRGKGFLELGNHPLGGGPNISIFQGQQTCENIGGGEKKRTSKGKGGPPALGPRNVGKEGVVPPGGGKEVSDGSDGGSDAWAERRPDAVCCYFDERKTGGAKKPKRECQE